MLITQIDFELEPTIKYVMNGDKVEAQKLILHAPSMKQASYASKIKQAFMRVSMEASKNSSDDKVVESDKKVTGLIMVQALHMSSINIDEIFSDFKKLITSGVATMDATNVLLDNAAYDRLLLEQCEAIFGAYLENFLMRALFQMT